MDDINNIQLLKKIIVDPASDRKNGPGKELRRKQDAGSKKTAGKPCRLPEAGRTESTLVQK